MYLFKVFGIVAITSVSNAQLGSSPCLSRLTVECSCPPQWQLWGKACYRLTPASHIWDDAKSACRDLDGKMAAPQSLEEMNFMTEMAPKVDNRFSVWIACNDKEEEGTWECDNQEGREPLVWDDGQPNNNYGDQNCARMASVHHDRMDDYGCDYRFTAFCVRRAACTHGLTQLRH
ncbi:C-type lectin domain family 4 member M-like [Patiria miniata]|uniref:C-type lectin domain-containing protein n=1 Tax=Patiria miniata TaxID=46514 RepID=A0A913ZXQ5_PATMI|nr:C-type lectin domain family 4 member M-like [Patiria miniata]